MSAEYTKILGQDVDVEQAKSLATIGVNKGKKLATEK